MLLGLGYPGGPAIERTAKEGDSGARRPAAAAGRAAGLRFFVLGPQDRGAARGSRRLRRALGAATAPTSPPPFRPPPPTCSWTARPTRLRMLRDSRTVAPAALVVAGGRGCQQGDPAPHRERWRQRQRPPACRFRRHRLCTDNAAMIAWAGDRAPRPAAWSTRSTRRRARAGRSTKARASPGVPAPPEGWGRAPDPRVPADAPSGLTDRRRSEMPTMSRPMSGRVLVAVAHPQADRGCCPSPRRGSRTCRCPPSRLAVHSQTLPAMSCRPKGETPAG